MSEELPNQQSAPTEDLLLLRIQILNEYKSKVTYKVAMFEEREKLKYAAKFRAAGLDQVADDFEEFFNHESSRQRYGGARSAYIAGGLTKKLNSTDDPET